MSFTLRILPRAERDVQGIFNYISQRSPGGAMRWWTALEVAIEELLKDPMRFARTHECSGTDHELRYFLFQTRKGRAYRGVFTVLGREVVMLRVRGPGQPPLQADEIVFE